METFDGDTKGCDPFDDGWDAASRGLKRNRNPYIHNNELKIRWNEGFDHYCCKAKEHTRDYPNDGLSP